MLAGSAFESGQALAQLCKQLLVKRLTQHMTAVYVQ